MNNNQSVPAITLTPDEEELWMMILHQQEQDEYCQIKELIEPQFTDRRSN